MERLGKFASGAGQSSSLIQKMLQWLLGKQMWETIMYSTKKLNPPDVALVKVNRKIGGYANGPNAFQITLKDEKIIEMDRHIKTLSALLDNISASSP